MDFAPAEPDVKNILLVLHKIGFQDYRTKNVEVPNGKEQNFKCQGYRLAKSQAYNHVFNNEIMWNLNTDENVTMLHFD